ncbi:SDR family NAD(P)-dependent oxidoreductase [Azotobacter armeniacus]
MGKLIGKIVVITGSDSGLGQAMATAFAHGGADVVVTYHSDSKGAQVTLERVQQADPCGLGRQLDVTDEASVAALFAAEEQGLGIPDILVNNAGIGMSGPVTELSTEDFDKVIKTDLYNPFVCSRNYIRRRQAVGSQGKILNITSVHDSPHNVAYGTAKGSLLTMTRSLALKLAPLRISVNTIAPGLIRTPMTMQRVDGPQKREDELPNIPRKRPIQPEEVAEPLYLVSPEADYITGQDFVIDGGLEMNWGQGV